MLRALCSVAAVPDRQLLRALFVAGRVRGALDQGNRLDRLLGRHAMTPLANMGQQLYEPPDVNGWELGPGWILDLVDAVAHELRVDARRQPEIQPRARRAAVSRRLRNACSTIMLARFPRRWASRRHDQRCSDYLRSDGAGPAVDAQLHSQGRRADPADRRRRRVSVQLGDGVMDFSRRAIRQGRRHARSPLASRRRSCCATSRSRRACRRATWWSCI